MLTINLPKNLTTRYVVAFSGGADSALLAYLLKRDGYNVRLVHVMHPDSKASKDAEEIRDFCVRWAETYFTQITVIELLTNEDVIKSKGTEAAEREARYTALFDNLLPNEVLLTGHHLDDSIETFFFRLCRGSSVKGLSGISNSKNSRLIRPFLHLSKKKILQQVEALSILYGHDSTNDNTELSRGFIRNKIIPLLCSHFSESKFYASLERVMQHMSECSELMEDLFNMDYQLCKTGETGICRVKLRSLSASRQRNLIYHYVAKEFGKFMSRSAIEEIRTRVIGPKKEDTFVVSGVKFLLQCTEFIGESLANEVNNVWMSR